MPFRARKDGKIVTPAEVESGERITCCECGEQMYVRDGEKRARHFVHTSEGSGCPRAESGGESDTHSRCVALAVATLAREFGEQASRYGAEISLDTTGNGSGDRVRRADAFIEFEDENPLFGGGLVVEVQYQNHTKAVEQTTFDYLSSNFSVVWLTPEDFDQHRLRFEMIERAIEDDGYTVRNQHPKRLQKCEATHYNDAHAWKTVPEYPLQCYESYQICVSQQCSFRRQYNDSRDEYVYYPDAKTPDLPLKAVTTGLTQVVAEWFDGAEEQMKDRYQTAVVEKALAGPDELAPCPGPKGFHEWEKTDRLDTIGGDLDTYICSRCRAYLTVNTRHRPPKKIVYEKRPAEDWVLHELAANPRTCSHECHDGHYWVDACPECKVSDPGLQEG